MEILSPRKKKTENKKIISEENTKRPNAETTTKGQREEKNCMKFPRSIIVLSNCSFSFSL